MIAYLRVAAGLGLLASMAACDGSASANGANDAAAMTNVAVAPAANAVAPMTDDANKVAAPAAPDRAAIQPLIDRIYGPYARGELGATPDDAETQGLRAAFAHIGENEDLDADPFCECQDFDHFSYRIASIEPSAGGAIARIAISNFGESKTIVLHLAQEGGQWRVSDVGEGNRSVVYMSRHGSPNE